MKTSFNQSKNEEGSVLILALFILVFLTIIGVSATKTADIELQIAGNEKTHRIVFYTADSGIEVGRAALNALKNADSGNWDNLFQGIQLTGQTSGVTTLNAVIDASGGRNVGPAVYSLSVRDNDDLDQTILVDTDNILILTSTGVYGDLQTRIETYVRYTGAGDEYAQEHYDTASTGEAAKEGSAVSGTDRW